MIKYIFSKALFEKNNIQDLGLEAGTIINNNYELLSSLLDQCMGHLNDKGLVDFEGFKHNGYVLPSLRISPKHCLKIEVK